MNVSIERAEERFRTAQRHLHDLHDALNAVIVGQESLITALLTALFSGGHVLIEGLPGLGKTSLAKAVAAYLDVDLGRIQCTPDLMPADITGSEILVRDAGGGESFDFRRGPAFASMLLVDEINRATPKTQAALLEAMQERQITHAGKRYPLPDPFWVIATQNPIELEGTYPLPEAQLDRFAMKLTVGFPSEEALLALADSALDVEPADRVSAGLDESGIRQILDCAKEVVIATPVKRAAVRLVAATQPEHENAAALAREHFRYGASPRALQALLRAARVHALFADRAQVALDDVEAVAAAVLRHRVLLRIESEVRGQTGDELLREIVSEWRTSA